MLSKERMPLSAAAQRARLRLYLQKNKCRFSKQHWMFLKKEFRSLREQGLTIHEKQSKQRERLKSLEPRAVWLWFPITPGRLPKGASRITRKSARSVFR